MQDTVRQTAVQQAQQKKQHSGDYWSQYISEGVQHKLQQPSIGAEPKYLNEHHRNYLIMRSRSTTSHRAPTYALHGISPVVVVVVVVVVDVIVVCSFARLLACFFWCSLFVCICCCGVPVVLHLFYFICFVRSSEVPGIRSQVPDTPVSLVSLNIPVVFYRPK